jgi:hypothetical protein
MTWVNPLFDAIDQVNTSIGNITFDDSNIIGNITAVNQSLFDNFITIIDLINGLANITVADIWNYTGTIGANVLNQIANAIYSLLLPEFGSINQTIITESSSINQTIMNEAQSLNQTISNINISLYENQEQIKTLVNSLDNLTALEVWTFIDRNLTDYNQTLMWSEFNDLGNEVGSLNITIESVNDSLNAQFGILDGNLSAINQTLYGSQMEIESKIDSLNNLTASDVWNFISRNLTYYPVTDLSDVLGNLTLIRDNQTAYYPFWNESFPINQTINVTIPVNVTANVTLHITNLTVTNISVFDVWNYNDRNLTYYPITDLSDVYGNLTEIRANQSAYFPFWNESFPINQTVNLTVSLNVSSNVTFNITNVTVSNISPADVWGYPSTIGTNTMQDVVENSYKLILAIITELNERLFWFF